MLRNRLIILVIISLFLHLGLFFLIYPVFDSRESKNFLYFWGQFDFRPSDDFPNKIKEADYKDFLLPLGRKSAVDFKKIPKKSLGQKIEPEIEINQSLARKKKYYFHPQKEYLSVVSPPWRDFFLKEEIRVNVLISPAGRAVWVKKANFSNDIFLRFDLDEWIRNLVFPTQGVYYWKSIEIVLK